jgi:hypothetical protein
MRLLAVSITLVLALGVSLVPGQDAKEALPPVRFWSGRLVEITDESVTVRRTLPGREPEDRKFLRTPATKVDGELALSVRVTVGYVQSAQTNVARRIVVRRPRK